ncbi:hypothetical protein ACFE04_016513 [Oxalis oulophora]
MTELWHACAGPLVYIPRAGENVFYFPQGHIEQVAPYTTRDGSLEMPAYNLPSNILCQVVCAELKVEPHTDEVYAQITLLPHLKQNEQNLGEVNPPDRKETHLFSFTKKLTPSDTSTHGGFSVPKRHADECLPPLDMSLQPPVQELVAKDLHGIEWRFRHIYRGQPKRHLLTSGWSTFVTSKKLVAGDSCIFLRGNNNQLYVGVRRAMNTQDNTLTTVISDHGMQHGILASTSHALANGTSFTVYYRPWTSRSEFIIPYHRYIKSSELNYSSGTRFRMQFEGDDGIEQRFSGTVVSIGDVDYIRWPYSQWRCLKVKWDSLSNNLVHPERVSPWNIENMESTYKYSSVPRPLKRPRSLDSSSAFPISAGDGSSQNSAEHVSCSHIEVLQGHKIKNSGVNDSSLPKPKPLLLQLLDPPQVSGWGHKHLEQKAENKGSSAQSKQGRSMLFGFNLRDNLPELPSLQLQIATSSALEILSSMHPTSQSSVSGSLQVLQPLKRSSGNPSEEKCKNCCLGISRSCTKVIKHGTVLGRSIDLMHFDGYAKLIYEMDHLFDFKGRLIDGNSGWQITYKDEEGDMMLIGDHYPWQLRNFSPWFERSSFAGKKTLTI